MIEFCKAFKTSTGETFASLHEAQKAELFVLLKADEPVIESIVENAAKVIDILSTTASSKPRARRINGGRKTRAVNKPPAPSLPMLLENGK